MAEECVVKNMGLRGVTVADTKISFIDGEKGVLIYRGYRIEDLAEHAAFEETAYLLLKGELPSKSELDKFRRDLAERSILPDFLIDSMKRWPTSTPPMQALMSAVAILGFTDQTVDNESLPEHEERAVRLIATLPVALLAWDRIRKSEEPLTYSPELTHAENILYQLSGKKPDPDIARVLDVCLTLHADHSFNASTFTSREIASTRADMYAAVLGGIGALSGPLHGGANERVMKMLKELEHNEDVDGWIRNQVESGQKIMGMGHAVYKTVDPRATILKKITARLGEKLNKYSIYRLSERIEKSAVELFESKGKSGIKPNVDFYSAPVYQLMGLSDDLFTPMFAVSRIAGWCAHIIEEKFGLAQPKPALYRPSADYVGNYCGLMGCEYRNGDKEV